MSDNTDDFDIHDQFEPPFNPDTIMEDGVLKFRMDGPTPAYEHPDWPEYSAQQMQAGWVPLGVLLAVIALLFVRVLF